MKRSGQALLMPIGLLAKRCLVRTYLIQSFGQRHDLILMMHLTVKNIHLNYYYIVEWIFSENQYGSPPAHSIDFDHLSRYICISITSKIGYFWVFHLQVIYGSPTFATYQSDLHNQGSRISSNQIFRVQYIPRHFIMKLCKNYVNLKHYMGQKYNIIVIKTAHRRSSLLMTLVSQEIFASIHRFKKKIFLKFLEFSM